MRIVRGHSDFKSLNPFSFTKKSKPGKTESLYTLLFTFSRMISPPKILCGNNRSSVNNIPDLNSVTNYCVSQFYFNLTNVLFQVTAQQSLNHAADIKVSRQRASNEIQQLIRGLSPNRCARIAQI
jgi:hypothetical protein